MSLRLACDLDGTLADMDSALQREAEQLFGSDVDIRAGRRIIPNRPKSALDGASPADGVKRPLSNADTRKLWARVSERENFWTTLEECERGSVARLAEHVAQRGWEVLFVTRRPVTVGDTPQIQTQRWLQSKGFELPSVFVVKGSRGRIADALSLDAVIDDLPQNAIDVATDSKATPILVWRDAPVLLPPAAAQVSRVVRSFSEALGILEEMSSPPTRGQRVLRRLRSLVSGGG